MPYFSQIRSSFMSRSRLRLQSVMNAPPRSEMSGTETPRRTTQSSPDDLVTPVSVRLGLAIGSSSQDRRIAYHALGCQLDVIACGFADPSKLAILCVGRRLGRSSQGRPCVKCLAWCLRLGQGQTCTGGLCSGLIKN